MRALCCSSRSVIFFWNLSDSACCPLVIFQRISMETVMHGISSSRRLGGQVCIGSAATCDGSASFAYHQDVDLVRHLPYVSPHLSGMALLDPRARTCIRLVCAFPKGYFCCHRLDLSLGSSKVVRSTATFCLLEACGGCQLFQKVPWRHHICCMVMA